MVLAAVLVVAAGVQVAFLRMPLAIDPAHYATWSRELVGLDLDMDYAHGQTRLGVLVPSYLAQHALGLSELSFHLVPFLLQLVLVGSTYLIGARLFGPAVGVVASLFLCTSVLLLSWSSQILPDSSGTAWFTLGVALMLTGGDRVRGRRLALIAAGTAACGMAYLCRENIVVLAPVVLLLAWRQRWGRPDWTVAVMVAVSVLLVEALGLWLLFGDPLARLHALTTFGRGSDLLAAYGENATVLTVLTRTPRVLLMNDQGIVLLVAALVAPVMAVVAARRERPAWQVLALWFGVFWVSMMWSAGLFDPQQPHLRDFNLRYWLPVLPALCLSLAAFVRYLARALPERRQPLAFLVLTLLLLLPFLADLRAFASEPGVRSMLRPTSRDEMRDWFAHGADGVREISTDARTAVVLPYYTRPFMGGEPAWQGRVNLILSTNLQWSPASEVHGTLVLPDDGLERETSTRVRSTTMPAEYEPLVRSGKVHARWTDGELLIVTVP